MKKINKFTFLLFLIFFLPLINSASWINNISKCNDYEYLTNQGFSGIRFHAGNGTIFEGMCYNCQYMTAFNLCSGFRINNTGHVDTWGGWGGAYWLTCLTSDLPCSSPPCSYKVEITNQGWYSYLNTSMTFPLYSGCATPTLSIVTSYPSTIMADRYRLNFTLQNTPVWSGITCSLTLSGTNSYATLFNTNGTVDILYSDYHKGFTTAHVVCTYNNQYNNTEIFADNSFLLDNTKTYNIYDAQRNIGRVSTDPNYLSVGSTLNKLKFFILSNPDREDYNKDLIGSLIMSSTPAYCTGIQNYSPIYLTHTINTPPYSIPLNWTCTQPATIPTTLTLTDLNTGANVATASFNVIWAQGSIIIDNVNLIENVNTFNLELWASVSNIFTHNPIPNALNDPSTVNLACTYSMTSQNYTTFTGTLGIYVTNVTSNNFTYISQTDAYNTTIDPATDFNYRDKFDIQINCTADNYTSASITTTRWISAKRIKTFVCYIGTETTQDHTVYYVDPYRTEASVIMCTVTLDTEINGEPDEVINYWLQHSTSQYLTLYSNYLSNDVNSPCPELRPLSIAPIYINNQKVGIRTNQAILGSLYAELPSCALTPITSGLITNNLVEFHAGEITIGYPFPISYNSTSLNYYPTTTVIPAFNLSYRQGAIINNPVLAIENNKITNKGIVTEGDTLSCSNLVIDPNFDISSISYSIYETDKGQSCTFTYPAGIDQFNATRTYSNILTVSKNSCHFFSSSNKNGRIKCKAEVYYSGQPAPVVLYSNIMPYKTANTGIGEVPNPSGVFNCTNDVWDIFKPNCPNFITRVDPIAFFGNQMRDDPEIFVLEFFLFIMFLFTVAILIIPLAKLFIMLRDRQRGS